MPDGRVLRVMLDGPYWMCELEGTGDAIVSGSDSGRLTSEMLADLLGYDVAEQNWPAWIDELATTFERDMR